MGNPVVTLEEGLEKPSIGAKLNIRFYSLPVIGLIGYGYWGEVICNALIRLGYRLDTIFTSKSPLQVQVQCRIILLTSEINIENISHLTHLFILTGPPYHHDILQKLELTSLHDDLLFMARKPFT